MLRIVRCVRSVQCVVVCAVVPTDGTILGETFDTIDGKPVCLCNADFSKVATSGVHFLYCTMNSNTGAASDPFVLNAKFYDIPPFFPFFNLPDSETNNERYVCYACV